MTSNPYHNAFQSPPHDQDGMRKHMEAAHLADLHDMATQGFTPPWETDDIILQVDEEKLLNLIADNGGFKMTRAASASGSWGLFDDMPTYTNAITLALGMNANANSQAVVNRCLSAGWIKQEYSEADECYILDLTAIGAYKLELHTQSKEWGE